MTTYHCNSQWRLNVNWIASERIIRVLLIPWRHLSRLRIWVIPSRSLTSQLDKRLCLSAKRSGESFIPCKRVSPSTAVSCTNSGDSASTDSTRTQSLHFTQWNKSTDWLINSSRKLTISWPFVLNAFEFEKVLTLNNWKMWTNVTCHHFQTRARQLHQLLISYASVEWQFRRSHYGL
jgi:hypothetical protein